MFTKAIKAFERENIVTGIIISVRLLFELSQNKYSMCPNTKFPQAGHVQFSPQLVLCHRLHVGYHFK